MKEIGFLKNISDGQGTIVKYAHLYKHINKETENVIFELVPPFIIKDKGKKIKFKSTKVNTDAICIIAPINYKYCIPKNIKVNYSIDKVYYMSPISEVGKNMTVNIEEYELSM